MHTHTHKGKDEDYTNNTIHCFFLNQSSCDFFKKQNSYRDLQTQSILSLVLGEELPSRAMNVNQALKWRGKKGWIFKNAIRWEIEEKITRNQK